MTQAVPKRRICIAFLAAYLIACSFAQAETYLYDAAGRLTRVTYSDGSVAFEYDNNGNILRRYKFQTPPDDPGCTGLEVTITGRVFTDNVTCSAVNWLMADTSQVNAGIEVIFVAPEHTLTNGFSIKRGSLFRIQSTSP